MKNNLKVSVPYKKRNLLVPFVLFKKAGAHKRSKRKDQRDLLLLFKKGAEDV